MSNLLEKASIITTPTAYSEGFIHTVKPEEALGSELVTNGDFATNTDWLLGSGSSISGGSLNIISAPYNAATRQALSLTSGKTYKIVINAIAVGSANSNTFQLGFGTTGGNPSSNTQYEFEEGASVKTLTVTASANDVTVVFRARNAVGKLSDLSITNVSVKEITDFTFTRNTTATRVNSQGLIESVGVDLPRINYENGCGSWLLEPSSLNLITRSNEFNFWNALSSRSTVTLNSITSPDGTVNGTKLTQIAVSSSARLRFSGILTVGNEYTFSIYAKKGNHDKIILTISDINTTFTLTDEWVRYEITETATATFVDVGITNGVVGDFIYIYGAQAEEASHSTSYIPTSGSPQSRSQDSATNAGNSNLINSTEGVLYAEIAALNNDLSHRRISLSDGTLNNLVYISFDTNSNTILVNANGKILNYTVSDETEFHKVAVLYNSTAPKLFINGVLRETETAMNPITALNQVRFDGGVGNNRFIGKAKCVAVFKEALTDAELICLTTINTSRLFSQRVLFDGGIIESLECVTI